MLYPLKFLVIWYTYYDTIIGKVTFQYTYYMFVWSNSDK